MTWVQWLRAGSGSWPSTFLRALATAMSCEPAFSEIDPEIALQLKRDALYANYIERQKRDVEALRRDEAMVIPRDFDFAAIEGLSNELKHKLSLARPENLAQAGKVDGMTPAALSLLLLRLRRHGQVKSA